MSTITTELLPPQITMGAEQAPDAAHCVPEAEALRELFGDTRSAGHVGAFALFQNNDWLLGTATLPLRQGLETDTRQLYESILQATRGCHLARIWNHVPAINEPGPGGLENYRLFCLGRSLAFEQHHGGGFKALLPSASAVGCNSNALTIIFAACHHQPRHVENPLQMSAYDYPSAYGPRAPSFARATVVPGSDRTTVFISGTAAIRGHKSIASHLLRPQLTCTVENLRAVSRSCRLGSNLDQGGSSTRHFKVYLRHATDQSVVADTLSKTFLRDTDYVSYVQADICRASLLVEIEVSIFGVTTVRDGIF